MGLRIRTNVQSLVAQRNLDSSIAKNEQAMEKLSSGYRINKASDDAAGLAISEKLRADYRGMLMAKRNASDGVSFIQTAEGGLSEISNILIRLRELSVQGASDTIGPKERLYLDREFGALKDEISRISRSTEYNGTLLLMGEEAQDAPQILKENSNPSPIEVQVGKSFYEEVDSPDSKDPINIIRIDLSNINADVNDGGLALGRSDDDDSTGVTTKQRSQKAINTLDNAIQKISSYRADLGALQSRLGSTINQLTVQAETNAAANSRIRDTDFAVQSSELTQTNIMKQSGTAILSQANQTPALALSLVNSA